MAQIDGRNPRPSATLEEVAHAAGVSRATVSRVVNGSPKVSPDVRRSVEREITRLGYVPNRAARSLVTRRSDSVGVVITEPAARLFVDPFFPRILRSISGELGSRDLQLVLLMPERGRDAARAEDYLTGGHVDGVLLVLAPRGQSPPHAPCRTGHPDRGRRTPAARLRRAFCRHRQPWRRTGRRCAPGRSRPPGHRHHRRAQRHGRRRRPACRLPRRTRGGRVLAPAATSSPSPTSGMTAGCARCASCWSAVPTSMRSSPHRTSWAAGAMQALREAGRRIPDDVAVVGFDDSPLAATTQPPLSSVRQPIEEMGREMVRVARRVDGATRSGAPSCRARNEARAAGIKRGEAVDA